MADYSALKKKTNELAERVWDMPAIEARVKKMYAEGIPRKKLEPKNVLTGKGQILDRVQRRAEEYNYFFHNCAQGTALALMEEFGLGNMEIIKALTLFPGIAGTGKICGGVTGSLIALGLYFTSIESVDGKVMQEAMATAQKFVALFEDRLSSCYCPDIIGTVILGHRLNPGESPAAMSTFAKEKGFEKCCLPPGIGARLAAELVINRNK